MSRGDWEGISENDLPVMSSATATSISCPVLLLSTADRVTLSPARKKRGAWSLTINGCFVPVEALAIPNWLPAVAQRAVAFQLVSESGYFSLMVALPSLSVMRSGCQIMVDRK